MIEDEKLGLKIANKDEAFWRTAKERTEEDIKSAKRSIEMNEHLLPFIETKINEFSS